MGTGEEEHFENNWKEREREKEEKEEPMKETGEGRRWQTNVKATGVETFKEIISSFHSDRTF